MTRITGVSRLAALVAVLALLVPATASAAKYDAARKIGRGLAGMTTSFLEVPGNMVQMSRDRGYGWGLSYGFVLGLGKIVPRTLVGVFETLTAPFEIPAGYRPILEPEFPWDYFEEKPARRR